jgi:hypothetical protein
MAKKHQPTHQQAAIGDTANGTIRSSARRETLLRRLTGGRYPADMLAMEDIEIFQRMGLALAIGAAVGVERHWREKDVDEGSRTAGIRTFTLIGLLGGVAGLLEHFLARPGGFRGSSSSDSW